MAGRLKGKRAFVTAAAQGIGRAIAEAYAAEGAKVFATDLNEAKVGELAAITGITTGKLDVTDGAAVAAMIAKAGEIDILVNAAGYVHNGALLDCTPDQWDFAFKINVESMFHTIKAVLPGMIARGGGSIVNIASVASTVKGVPNRFVYGTTKAAVLGLTKSVAADYVGHKVRCNAICPGTVQTPSLDDRINANPDPAAARAKFIERQPIGRLGTPEEMAAAAVYLGGDESGYTTGIFLTLDGGMTI